jgi:hypothetical protein
MIIFCCVIEMNNNDTSKIVVLVYSTSNKLPDIYTIVSKRRKEGILLASTHV